MSKMKTLLIIDDDKQLVSMLRELLKMEGYVVHDRQSGEQGLRFLRDNGDVDAVILDVMMPGMDGFETLTRLRHQSDLPVIMLTARGEADDRVLGLEHGANDYLPKPFNPRELLLRLRVMLKQGQSNDVEPVQTFHELTLDNQNLRATLGDVTLKLTGAEFSILQTLMGTPGEVQSRESLSSRALGRQTSPYDRALDTHISNLRSKLGGKAATIIIKSVRGAGYTLLYRSAAE